MFTSQELLLFVSLATHSPQVDLSPRVFETAQSLSSNQPVRVSRRRNGGSCVQCRRGSGRREILGLAASSR
ncbi:MAG: hypothetical protein SW833_17100 [Cyanobacteriota bacterium]|nr:hypothetical protein [Cyanobacteriota bacterium]